jgi:NAD(P)H-dependent flavin oxidoreductase YrpB (nitropropane dioxygenase family)
MLRTRFTEMLDCRLPIQQAPMGGVASVPQLAVAVAAAGATGMLNGVRQSADTLAAMLDGLPPAPDGAIGLSFLVPFIEDQAVVELAAARTPLVDFFWGEPDPALVALVHGQGALAGWQVGSVDEARAAEEAGCDLVVAQGVEAGGHVRGRLGLLPLLDLVLDAVDVPVVAAGGLGTARSVAAVLAAGADAARLGTRLIATDEAAAEGAHRDYVDALVGAGAEDTTVTEAFSLDVSDSGPFVAWPSAPHRVLSSCLAAAAASDGDVVGRMRRGEATLPVPRWAVSPPSAHTSGEIAAMALYAGQSVGAVDRVRPAGELVTELAHGAERLLRICAPQLPS